MSWCRLKESNLFWLVTRQLLFHMSYAGWDRVYRDDTTEAPPPLRDVAGELPLRSTREKDRGECFLGQECP